MRRNRWILVCVLLVATGAGWLAWVRPNPVDMAAYAPADSLLYLEANRPLVLVEAIASTDAWKEFEKVTGTIPGAAPSPWLQRLVGWTGIGPIQSVILARAQIAAVVTDLGTAEEGETLRIKPEGAILIETHTAQRRITPPFEEALKSLAEKTYGRPTLRRVTLDGLDFVEWSAPDGTRQIVGTVMGSLIIVGNSERAVQTCVAVSLGRRPRLKDDPELNRMRLQLGGEAALTFGFVPTGNSARLLAVAVPLLLGRAPADSDFQRLITNGAAKVFGSLGWTAKPYLTGIEDRYLITLQPEIVAHLKPGFGPAIVSSQMTRVLPNDFYSVTSYKFASPSAALQSLRSAVSSQVDALSAIVFSTLLRSALLSYGIDEPETFLDAVNGELLTLRPDDNAERSLIVAGVRDRAILRELVLKKMKPNGRVDRGEEAETFENSAGDFAASLTNEHIVIGSPSDVRRYAELTRTNATLLTAEELRKLNFFVSHSSSANIVTYTNDDDRVRSFLSAVLVAKGAQVVGVGRIEEAIAGVPYSVTETTLEARGLERITRSSLGQFSTILPLLFPEQSNSIKTQTQSP